MLDDVGFPTWMPYFFFFFSLRQALSKLFSKGAFLEPLMHFSIRLLLLFVEIISTLNQTYPKFLCPARFFSLL